MLKEDGRSFAQPGAGRMLPRAADGSAQNQRTAGQMECPGGVDVFMWVWGEAGWRGEATASAALGFPGRGGGFPGGQRGVEVSRRETAWGGHECTI